MIRVDIRPRQRNSHKADADRRFPTHLAWLRKRPCLLAGRAGHICEGVMEASHSDADGMKGLSLKSPDYHAVPLCSGAHREKDSIGLRTWQAKYSVDHLEAGRAYGKASPHRARWAHVEGAPR
ncbi:hypothetical protein [Sphingomonas sp. PvP056]|uniref:hypothetical protein n=1 Tax=Sphingomonas sp. PvP056 TaxID=3156392 RepID=UPI003395C593